MEQKRIVITNIAPQVEGGLYPARISIHEGLQISADIFCDGHDDVEAEVSLKHRGDKRWKEYPMQFVSNDRFIYQSYELKPGGYRFTVKGWVNEFNTWKKDLVKKLVAGRDITVDLQMGALLLEQYAERAGKTDKQYLLKCSHELPLLDDQEKLMSMLSALPALMSKYRDTQLDTVSERIFEIEVERMKASYSAWYELFPRSASPYPGKHGTLKDIKRLLPRIQEMGFDVLYLPPIHPIGKTKRKGKNNTLKALSTDPGSPWAIGNKDGGHKSIHPKLGTLDDFKDLIAAAGRYNIEIAMDIALQCSPDHPYIQEHPEWFRWRPDGTVQYAENPPKKYEDIVPFYFENSDWKNLWKELKSIFDYWVDAGIRIFRVDNPHTKPFAFWQWMIAKVRRQHPEVIFLAEAFTRPRVMENLAKIGFNQSYTYFAWRNTKRELEEYLTELTATERRWYFRPNFWPNTPDILTDYLVHGGENAHIIRLMLAATLSSSYGIYGPVYEFTVNEPFPGKEEYNHNEKYEVKYWHWEQETRMQDIITLVNRIRREHQALHQTANIVFAETTNQQLICYCKYAGNDRLIIAVNLDPYNTQGAHVVIPLRVLGIDSERPYTVRDMLSGDKYRWQSEWNYVQLDPYEMPAHIFRIEQEEINDQPYAG